MDRRNFLKLPLAGAVAAGAMSAAAQSSAQAAPLLNLPQTTSVTRALKGFGNGGKDALALQQINSLKLDWYYTWQAQYYVNANPPFVPMIKDASKLSERDAIGWITRQLPVTKTKHLLGFNEPDHASQANMTPDEAIKLWPQLMATGLRLGAPAPAGTNSLWLESFMSKAKAKGLRVDFVTMHRYAWPKADEFLRKVTMLHEKYGKPIWVTEYAVADWDATPTRPSIYTRAQTEDFMRATVAGMRAMPFVERFAWKTRSNTDPAMRSSSLFNSNGTLTSTGKLYSLL
ncbi:glycosyl hydrolase [Arthrobacter sp. MDT1-48-3]